MKPAPAAFSALDEALAEDVEAIRHVVRMCLALEAEGALRAFVLRGDASRALMHNRGSVRLVVTDKGISLSRTDAGETGHDSLTEILTDASMIMAANRLPGWRRYGKQADRLLHGLLGGERTEFRSLLDWAPVIEPIAYRASARISTILDADRSVIVERRSASPAEHRYLLRRYWALASLMSRLTLLATTPGASGWLVEMSRSFVWTRWTPSVVLVRERLLGFSAIAGRAAAEFGPAVLTDYAGALQRARLPILSLDAVLGITAIALRHPSARDDARLILSERLRSLGQRDDVADATLLLGLRQALRLVEVAGEKREPLAEARRNFYADAFAFARDGECPALASLPGALGSPAWMTLPPQQSHAGRAIPEDVGATIFDRAWGPDPAPAARPVLH